MAGTLTATVTPSLSLAAPLSGSGLFNPVISPQVTMTTALSGAGTLGPLVAPNYAVPAAFSGSGAMTAGLKPNIPMTVNFGGGGQFSPVARASITANFGSTGQFAPTAAFPVTAPVQTSFQTAGNFTYTIPYWCNKIDVIVLGGGGGGADSTIAANSMGGYPGVFNWLTVVRGATITWANSSLKVTVGAAGPHANIAGGGDSKVDTVTNVNLATGAGGAGGDGVGDVNGDAVNSGNTNAGKDFLFNGVTYVGGGVQTAGASGNAPGGGGHAATASFSAGYAGAPGRVWFRAYQ